MEDHLVSRDRFLGVTTFNKAILAMYVDLVFKKCLMLFMHVLPFLVSKVKACVLLGSKYTSCSCKTYIVGIEGITNCGLIHCEFNTDLYQMYRTIHLHQIIHLRPNFTRT